jgi:branched-chain amino acid aminotransferase
MDGEYVPWRAANMHLSAHHYGVGVFEGVRAYAGERGVSVFRLRDHTARLFRSAHILNIAIPEQFGEEKLNEVQIDIIRKNDLKNAYLRPFVFYGGTTGLSRSLAGLRVHVAVFALGWRDAADSPRTLKLRTSSFTRAHANSQLSKAKANGNYMNGILALQEAQSAGADEALLLDQRGFATETSGSNLFVLQDGVLVTPPLEAALDGITRRTVIEIASELGIRVLEKQLSRDDIYVADEVFVTGTAAEISAVSELDSRKIRGGAPGPVTRKLQTTYAALVRSADSKHSVWSTAV